MKSLTQLGITRNPWFHVFPVTYIRIQLFSLNTYLDKFYVCYHRLAKILCYTAYNVFVKFRVVCSQLLDLHKLDIYKHYK